jgi:uncharacterized protein YegL
MAKKTVKKTTTTTVVEEITSNEKTEILCVLDRSGSMSRIIDDAIGGFNEFIKDQKEIEGEATMSVALFDDNYQLLYDNVDIKEVEEFDRKTWTLGGMTALNDAIGKMINDVENRRAKQSEDEKASKVLVVIVTDGYENSSKEFTAQQVKDLISKKKKDDWQFIFLAATDDAFTTSSGYGISAGNTMQFTANSTGTITMSNAVNNATRLYRSTSLNSTGSAVVYDNLLNTDDINDDSSDDNSDD